MIYISTIKPKKVKNIFNSNWINLETENRSSFKNELEKLVISPSMFILMTISSMNLLNWPK